MALYKILKEGDNDVGLSEIKSERFEEKHQEDRLEDWVELKPEMVNEGKKLLIIGRQVEHPVFGALDLLGVNKVGDLIVIENKRNRTPDETIAQILRYMAWGERQNYDDLNDIACDYFVKKGKDYPTLQDAHRQTFLIDEEDPSAEVEPLLESKFNQDQKGIIFAQKITQVVGYQARYLQRHDLEIQCHEFKYYKRGDDELIEHEVRVGKIEEKKEAKYLDYEGSLNKILDENVKKLFEKFVIYVKEFKLVNVNFKGTKDSGFTVYQGEARWMSGYTTPHHFRIYLKHEFKEDEIEDLRDLFPQVTPHYPSKETPPVYKEVGLNILNSEHFNLLKKLITKHELK